ncbi:hypothetical protein [Elizabethkingia miricola]|uniref:Uncharacterized protein n=1 Tax=Elizabethkingia miricola TaxID=172045 RepID=A0ABD5B5N0_ELIMR|nr:hypothetical protein [Elizabethkingia miricola]MDQ8748363.1 hypothetical protein [Elizabethkingia miricola]
MEAKAFTHYMMCFQYAGKNKKRRYFDQCYIIRMKGDEAYVCYQSSVSGKTGKRYIDAARLLPIYENY